jgi:phage terminase large subunit GpA-like protein
VRDLDDTEEMTKCPRCGSWQYFKIVTKTVTVENKRAKEKKIQCRKCRWTARWEGSVSPRFL